MPAVAHARVIRDPVYGYIHLPHALAPLVDHPLYQRLRRISQTSLTPLVYPSTTGSRFEHGLGAMHLARLAWLAAYGNAWGTAASEFRAAVGRSGVSMKSDEDFGQFIGTAVACAALLHDVGHPPFSHALEGFFERLAREEFGLRPSLLKELDEFDGPFHELAGRVVLPELLKKLQPVSLRKVSGLIYRAEPGDGSWEGCLRGLIDGEIDVDRLDYLMRDSDKAGTEFGAIDYERLVDALELHRDDGRFLIAPGLRARSAVETVLVQRSQAYRWMYRHSRVVGYNLALERAAETWLALSRTEDVILVGRDPKPIKDLFPEAGSTLNYLVPTIEGVSGYLGLGDAVTNVNDLAIEFQAGVDDARIVEAIKRAVLVAQALLSEHQVTRETNELLQRMVTYGKTAVFRDKNLIVAWKTSEEFGEVVQLMLDDHGLRDKVAEAFEVARRSTGDEGPASKAVEDRALRLLDDNPVKGGNYLMDRLLSHEDVAAELKSQLDQAMPKLYSLDGFWELSHSTFEAIRASGVPTVLYRQGEPEPLVDKSPLIRSLFDVEENRNKFLAFFFLRHPGDSAGWTNSQNPREELQEAFAAAFPPFVKTFGGPAFALPHPSRRGPGAS